jgi:hypothetical protein
MDLTPKSILKRAPNLKVQGLYDETTIIFLHDQWIKCKSHGLAILDAFAQPIEVSKAVKRLEALFIDARDRAEALDLICNLYRAGFLLSQAEGTPVSPVEAARPTFACFLHEQSPPLLPNSAGRTQQPALDPKMLVISKRIQIQLESESPPGLEETFPHCERFLAGYPLLWARHPGTKILAPYWLDNAYLKLIRGLMANQISPTELEPLVLATLTNAKVLVSADSEESESKAWTETLAKLRTRLQAEQYAVVRDIIDPLQIAALRKYFRTLDHKNFLIPDLQGGSVRYALHNETVAQFIHHQLSNLVRIITGEAVMPSYSFLSVYKTGSFLAKHSDRAQCAWNLSLLIDTDPEKEPGDSWPIFLEVGSQIKEVRLEMGAGLLYRGTAVPHWREALGEGEANTLILCHFVREDFAGDLN